MNKRSNRKSKNLSTRHEVKINQVRWIIQDIWIRVIYLQIDSQRKMKSKWLCIRLFQKFLSFYKKTMDAQHFLYFIILLNYIWSILFY